MMKHSIRTKQDLVQFTLRLETPILTGFMSILLFFKKILNAVAPFQQHAILHLYTKTRQTNCFIFCCGAAEQLKRQLLS